MSPEEKARLVIDKKLAEVGYKLQDMSEFNPAASLGVAVREFPTNSGEVDYLLFIDKKPVGVIEAKPAAEGENLHAVAEQSLRYAQSGLKYVSGEVHVRFAYEATDTLIHFADYGDQKYRTRSLFAFHRPEVLKAWLCDTDTLRNRLKAFPPFDSRGFRDCQTSAVVNLEHSFSENRPRALIQMATGAGKTYTAITTVYRLLKFAKARRILFLVDTKNLGIQAEEEFLKYKPNDDPRLFPELYTVQRLKSSSIDTNAKVCISTIQRMYSILRGEEMDDSLEEVSLSEVKVQGPPREVKYSPRYPIEFFDFIIIDECHRSIYNIWQQVLDYFDAFLIGLTATPDERTFGFFNKNVVSEYTHEQAVIDHVNVDGDIFLIETDVTKNGAHILKQMVEKRERLSRRKRWEMLDEDVIYSPTQLDRDVVNESQMREVIRCFRENVFSSLFPGRAPHVPKTLVFAKTDSHADDLVRIIREEFGEGNEFCKKITHKADNPQSVLAAFRNNYDPRIAVTVDMIATGTDVKPIECLLFMRDVRSQNYFEQMKGRATRVLDYESLHYLNETASHAKDRYVLVDAVGVTKSKKTTTRPLDRKPSVSLKDLMMSVALGARDDDTLTTLATRLTRLDTVLTRTEKQKAQELGEKPLNLVAAGLLDAFDPDGQEDYATEHFQLPPDQEPNEEQLRKAEQALADEAAQPFFSPKFREFLENARRNHDQVMDTANLDHVNYAGWADLQGEKAAALTASFRQYIEENRDTVEALSIIYSRAYRERPLTFQIIRDLHEKLLAARLSGEAVWRAYAALPETRMRSRNVAAKLADIVSLVRYALGQTNELTPFAEEVSARFRDWVFQKNAGHVHFTDEQMAWLRMIRDHVATSACIAKDDLETTPFNNHGGLGKFYQLFGADYTVILEEINLALVA